MENIIGSVKSADLIKTELMDSLAFMERGYSPFEKAVREMRVSVCDAFKKSGAIAPVTFEPGTKTLEPNHEIAEAFPNSIAASQNIILAASGAMTA